MVDFLAVISVFLHDARLYLLPRENNEGMLGIRFHYHSIPAQQIDCAVAVAFEITNR